MEILNIGIPELIFIFLIMLIFLGPEGFSQSARGLARMIRKLIHSPIWNDVVKAQRDIQELPTRMIREAGIDEIQQEMVQLNQQTQNELNTIRQSVPFTPPAAAQTPVLPAAVEPETAPEEFDYRAAALGSEAGPDGTEKPEAEQPLPTEIDRSENQGQESS